MSIARIAAWLAALVGAALLGGVAGAVVYSSVDEDTPAAITTTAPGRTVVQAESYADLYERVAPSVVEVETGSGASSDDPFRVPRQGGTGTGWVYDSEGHVVTNQHVVGDAREVTVRFADGREVDAEVVATDPSSDVALLRLESTNDLPAPLERGAAEGLQVGDPVVAIGSPFGLQGSLTTGVVSGLGRTITAPNEFGIDDVVQTDAALNPGNSGGPLLAVDGRVVGMNAQIASQSGGNQGIGYAIPIETVERVVTELLEDGRVDHAFLGVRLADADEGARIVAVNDGSPADDAGLRPGDLVVRAGGEPVDSADDLRRAVNEREPGDELELEVERDGDRRTVTVELGTRPSS
jgi:putative serine protease PepD